MINKDWLECMLTSYYLFIEQYRGDPDVQVLQYSVGPKVHRKVSTNLATGNCIDFGVDSETNICEDNLSRKMIVKELEKHSETVELKLDVDCRVAGLEITHNLVVVTNNSFDPSSIVGAPLVLKFNWRQSKMYSSLLVDIRTELETLGYRHIAPHCLHARYIPGFESTIVLDNLENQGYNHLPNNDEVFSFNQVSTILQNVALLHCSGLLLKQKHHANLSISYPFLMNVDMYVQWRVHLFKQGLNYRKDILEGFLPKVNTDKLRNFVQNLGNKVEEIISQKKPYSTIIHGDLELKNILIREDSCVFTNWYVSLCTNPAIELTYIVLLMNLCNIHNWRINAKQQYEQYWTFLVEISSSTNCNLEKHFGLTSSNLLQDCSNCELFAFISCIGNSNINDEEFMNLVNILVEDFL